MNHISVLFISFAISNLALANANTTQAYSCSRYNCITDIVHRCRRPDVAIDVLATPDHFEPSTIHLKEGETVCLRFSSNNAIHGFVIDELNIHIHINPAFKPEIQFKALKAGKYEYFCDKPSMRSENDARGLLIIEKANSKRCGSKTKR